MAWIGLSSTLVEARGVACETWRGPSRLTSATGSTAREAPGSGYCEGIAGTGHPRRNSDHTGTKSEVVGAASRPPRTRLLFLRQRVVLNYLGRPVPLDGGNATLA